MTGRDLLAMDADRVVGGDCACGARLDPLTARLYWTRWVCGQCYHYLTVGDDVALAQREADEAAELVALDYIERHGHRPYEADLDA